MSTSLLDKIENAVGGAFDALRDIADVLFSVGKRRGSREVVSNKRLTIVQFGDYAEAFLRFANGGSETYYAQRYTVNFITSLAAQDDIESLTIIHLDSNAAEKTLPNRVRSIGIQLYPHGQRPRHRELVRVVANTHPTHLIVMSPVIPLIAWAIRNRITTLPMLADSFRVTGLKAALRHRLLALLLNSSAIDLVANHNLAASLDLERIGVDSSKILPFDWPALVSPRNFDTKYAPPSDRPFRLLYVGTLSIDKGVGDAIKALAMLHGRGRRAELTVIGRGDQKYFEEMAATENVRPDVSFLGLKGHSEVIAAMRDSDAVLVPSRWSYPEGLPMTLYEALCTRTPLITSNHPMFALRIHDQENALVFPERDADRFADCIENLANSPELYARLSANSANAADNYLCPLKYDRLISAFLSPLERDTLRRYSLMNSKPVHRISSAQAA